MKMTFKKILLTVYFTLFFVLSGYFAYAQFVEPGTSPADSVQDFVRNILGANNGNNEFDSSQVAANKNGSLIEVLEYISGEASSTKYYIGGNDYYCQKKMVDSVGFVSITNINDGYTCNTQKECASGDCLTSGGYSCVLDADCADANCDTDYDSATKYCHATSTSCINGPGENVYDDGYELCSGDSFYKSCSSSVWGSEQYPADSYCDAGGGAQSGYVSSTTMTCSSGASGGFDAGTCISCEPYLAESIDSCKTSCVSSDDCWSGSACSSNVCLEVCSASTACGDSCIFNSMVYSSVTASDGECWLDRNLGASRAAVSYNDTSAYGYIYQWGRLTDGHQISTSDTTTTLSSSNTPGHSSFIVTSAYPYDWRSPQYNSLWQGVNGTNNPCPSGFRLPTITEWQTLISSESITEKNTAFSSSLKLPASGYRGPTSPGSYLSAGTSGYYWSSTVNGVNAERVYIYTSITTGATQRATGAAVRCLKN